MRISITTEIGQVHSLEVDSQIELENIKALIEAETGIPPAEQVLLHNGREMTDPKRTLEQYGVIQDEILFLQRIPTTSSVPTEAPELEQMRHALLNNNQMMQQLLQGSLNADPFDIEAQRRIEEAIRMENVNSNMDTALEYYPEAFGRVVMLYINVEVNGHPVKAFVDSGAQATIMSPHCAENCGIMRLVDTRFAGIAKGVGTAKIIGRVHSADIRVGEDMYLACSFTIMEGRGVDLLFGLDMLRRHQACIDLNKNALVINGKEIRFLAEHELPESARVEEEIPEPSTSSSSLPPPPPTNTSSSLPQKVTNPPNSMSSAVASATAAAASAANHASSSSQGIATPRINNIPQVTQSRYPEEDVAKLVSMGISRVQAIELLRAANGNVEVAASLFFG